MAAVVVWIKGIQRHTSFVAKSLSEETHHLYHKGFLAKPVGIGHLIEVLVCFIYVAVARKKTQPLSALFLPWGWNAGGWAQSGRVIRGQNRSNCFESSGRDGGNSDSWTWKLILLGVNWCLFIKLISNMPAWHLHKKSQREREGERERERDGKRTQVQVDVPHGYIGVSYVPMRNIYWQHRIFLPLYWCCLTDSSPECLRSIDGSLRMQELKKQLGNPHLITLSWEDQTLRSASLETNISYHLNPQTGAPVCNSRHLRTSWYLSHPKLYQTLPDLPGLAIIGNGMLLEDFGGFLLLGCDQFCQGKVLKNSDTASSLAWPSEVTLSMVMKLNVTSSVGKSRNVVFFFSFCFDFMLSNLLNDPIYNCKVMSWNAKQCKVTDITYHNVTLWCPVLSYTVEVKLCLVMHEHRHNEVCAFAPRSKNLQLTSQT